MSRDGRTVAEVDGHRVTLTNLDKVLYPGTGLTKAGVVSYYARIAPVLLPHVRDRPVTLRRYPDGVDGGSFFEKHAPRGLPGWIATVPVPRLGSRGGGRGKDDDIVQVLLSGPADLVWVANLAALELHVPMWRAVRAGEYGPVDLMVFDLDPGAPADIVDCCRVGGWLRTALEGEGLDACPKTSGSKGLQLYVRLDPPRPWEAVRDGARALARAVERGHRDAVVTNMRRDLRGGKVLIDWSQNHPAKTTVAAYSLRARDRPTVSAPVSWEEVEACARSGRGDRLAFDCSEVLERVERRGDLFAPLLGGGRG